MTYELAQRLKDAGFPQHNEENNTVLAGMPQAYIPTLSELIEACGERFYALYAPPRELIGLPRQLRGIQSWVAVENGSKFVPEEIIDFGHCGGTGSTPEEAVANLWLKLQEHV